MSGIFMKVINKQLIKTVTMGILYALGQPCNISYLVR
jgi:hypothetical protein